MNSTPGPGVGPATAIGGLGPTAPLRPLGLGEVLDRAVSLTIRGFVLLSLIYLVLAVPRAFVQYFAFQNANDVIKALVQGVQNHTDPTTLANQMQGLQSSPVVVILGLLLSLVVVPLTVAALTIACTTVYFGGKMTFNEAYKAALGRWLQLILLNIVWFAVLMVIVTILTFVAVIVGVGLFALATFFKTVGIIFAAIAGLAALVFLLGVGLLLLLAWQLSIVTCVVERTSFFEASISGSKRVLSGLGIRRSLLVGLIFALIYGGLGLAQSVGTYLLILLVHQTAAGTLYATLFSVLTQIVGTAFMVIFYFDMRVREDGLDLELASIAQSPASA